MHSVFGSIGVVLQSNVVPLWIGGDIGRKDNVLTVGQQLNATRRGMRIKEGRELSFGRFNGGREEH